MKTIIFLAVGILGAAGWFAWTAKEQRESDAQLYRSALELKQQLEKESESPPRSTAVAALSSQLMWSKSEGLRAWEGDAESAVGSAVAEVEALARDYHQTVVGGVNDGNQVAVASFHSVMLDRVTVLVELLEQGNR